MYETVRLVLEMPRNYNQSKEVPVGAQPLRSFAGPYSYGWLGSRFTHL
jgi:hypothetical protein